jgi:hypothetical protein
MTPRSLKPTRRARIEAHFVNLDRIGLVCSAVPMSETDEIREYRRGARECAEIAAKIGDPGQRLLLLEMAQAWMNLGEKAEKSRGVDVVTAVGSG